MQGRLLDLSQPVVMGILNVTPDSFYDGNLYGRKDQIQEQAGKMLQEGAAIIDIGGYSSRSGALHIAEEEEISRVMPAIEAVLERYPDAILSVDTFRSGVARAAVQAGVSMVNDISAGTLDERMAETVASLKVPYLAMHMRGTPQSMQQESHYDDLIGEIIAYFHERLARFQSLGIRDIAIDPGFGFAKTIHQNYELLKNLQELQLLGRPVVAGLSRKSMIWKTLGVTAAQALNGTTALHMVALGKGANILRVHDVLQACDCIRLWQHLHPFQQKQVSHEA